MKQFLFFIGLLCTISLSAQITYYEVENGDILDVFAFERLKKKLSEKGQVIHNTVSQREVNDSLIKKVEIEIIESNPNGSYFDPYAVHRKRIGERFPIEEFLSSDSSGLQDIELNGKPTLINFWFTSCRPCVLEIPILNEMVTEFDGEANFVAITFDRTSRVEQFLKLRKFDFDHITDVRPAIDKMGVQAFPMNVLLDKNGVIVEIYGDVFADRYNLSALIRKMINEG